MFVLGHEGVEAVELGSEAEEADEAEALPRLGEQREDVYHPDSVDKTRFAQPRSLARKALKD